MGQCIIISIISWAIDRSTINGFISILHWILQMDSAEAAGMYKQMTCHFNVFLRHLPLRRGIYLAENFKNILFSLDSALI